MEMKDHAELSNGEWHHVEMPEKPNGDLRIIGFHAVRYAEREYESAVKLALQNKVRFADQERVKDLILRPGSSFVNQTAHLAIEENHLYPLDGVKVRRVYDYFDLNTPLIKRKRAIIED